MKNATFNIVAGTLLAAVNASGALITGTLIAEFDGTTPNPNMTPQDAIDGTGLSSLAFGATHSTTWRDHWYSTDLTGFITVDLEANYLLDTIWLWNENEDNAGNDRGFQNFEIWVSPDTNTGNLVKLTTDGTGSQDNGTGDFILAKAPQSTAYTGTDLDLGGITNSALLGNARLVSLQAIDNYGSSGGVGLAEVQFGGTDPIPEPASSLLASLGAFALIASRRRKGLQS